jgi:hypothetical protein
MRVLSSTLRGDAEPLVGFAMQQLDATDDDRSR